jgi:ABC-type dipeptide/oligopeptide/nickel transport system ATPase component
MSTAETLTLIGLSGMGKTTALNSIAKLYPQVISHSKYKEQIFIETQVVWLKIDCPHDGSLRGFVPHSSSLDEALGIKKYSGRAATGRSISVMLQNISQLCKTYFIGALIIDEMQHLCSSRGGQDRESSQLLCSCRMTPASRWIYVASMPYFRCFLVFCEMLGVRQEWGLSLLTGLPKMIRFGRIWFHCSGHTTGPKPPLR